MNFFEPILCNRSGGNFLRHHKFVNGNVDQTNSCKGRDQKVSSSAPLPGGCFEGRCICSPSRSCGDLERVLATVKQDNVVWTIGDIDKGDEGGPSTVFREDDDAIQTSRSSAENLDDVVTGKLVSNSEVFCLSKNYISCKTVLFLCKRRAPIVCVVRDDCIVDRRKLGVALGLSHRDISLATYNQCIELAGYYPSVIPPLGHKWLERSSFPTSDVVDQGRSTFGFYVLDSLLMGNSNSREQSNYTPILKKESSCAPDNHSKLHVLILGAGCEHHRLVIAPNTLVDKFGYFVSDIHVEDTCHSDAFLDKIFGECGSVLPGSEHRTVEDESQIRFLADSMLSRTAKWLRCSGIDVENWHDSEHDRSSLSKLLDRALVEKRVLLTRDKKLLERCHMANIHFVPSNDPEVDRLLLSAYIPLSYV